MSTILDRIVANKHYEVTRAKQTLSQTRLESHPGFQRRTLSLAKALRATDSSGIIAEYKRKSPSKGIIQLGAGIAETTQGYTKAGAAGISVLTDTVFFGGFKEDLYIARENNPLTPLIRKDFMVDPYQLFEARAWGADVVLLIASCLTPDEIASMSQLAKQLELEVLLEVHDAQELQHAPLDHVDLVGVNNRNLKIFSESNVQASLDLVDQIPQHLVKVSESCIDSPETVQTLRAVGYQGFLIGELFMRQPRPADALAQFIS
ncbi:MAG: indole-3-glycerol phosphate synthase TrpC [Spirosomataceae bacterium]